MPDRDKVKAGYIVEVMWFDDPVVHLGVVYKDDDDELSVFATDKNGAGITGKLEDADKVIIRLSR